MQSRDLVNWTFTGEYVFRSAPVWSNGNDMWAPEIHKIGSTFAAYYVAASRTGRLCIGVATAHAILGPYADIGRPLVQDNAVGLIDPTVFTDGDGKHYLYYKSDGNAIGQPTYIYVQKLAVDGRSVTGRPTPIIRNDRAWEGNSVEAPWVTKRAGRYYLFYSGNTYNTPGYAIGVARSSSPNGGFVKKATPILRSNATWYGPGHNSIATGPNGGDQIVYHAFAAGPWRDVRPTLVEPLTWVDGWPSVGDGTPTSAMLPYP
jgi:beta-xylosidase